MAALAAPANTPTRDATDEREGTACTLQGGGADAVETLLGAVGTDTLVPLGAHGGPYRNPGW